MTSNETVAPGRTDVGEAQVESPMGGMTCASCAARIEKKLNRMDGVTATVNYATEKAQVRCRRGTGRSTWIATVEATGYTAAAARRRARSGGTGDPTGPRRSRTADVALAAPATADLARP